MSLHLVELQIAIPRTQDVGKLQNELNDRTNITNAQMHHIVQKEEVKRKSVNENEKTYQLKEEKERKSQQDERFLKQKEKQQKQKSNEGTRHSHPFKGHYIDYSG